MRLSIIIPVYKDFQGLCNTLKSLEVEFSEDAEVIVVFDGKDQKTEIPTWALPVKKSILAKNQGSYAARNVGIRLTKNPYLLFVDTGVVLKRGFRNAVLKETQETDYLAFCIGITNATGDSLFKRYFKHLYFNCTEHFERDHFGVTACLWVRRALVDQVGGFKASLRSGGDLEFGQRCFRRGAKMNLIKECLAFHPAKGIAKHYQALRRIFSSFEQLKAIGLRGRDYSISPIAPAKEIGQIAWLAAKLMLGRFKKSRPGFSAWQIWLAESTNHLLLAFAKAQVLLAPRRE